MWSMTVDDLLNLLGRSDIFAQAYAYDVVVSVAGKLTEVLSHRMQTACSLIQGWCNQCSLGVHLITLQKLATSWIQNTYPKPRRMG